MKSTFTWPLDMPNNLIPGLLIQKMRKKLLKIVYKKVMQNNCANNFLQKESSKRHK